jgi:hypothetical protein
MSTTSIYGRLVDDGRIQEIYDFCLTERESGANWS